MGTPGTETLAPAASSGALGTAPRGADATFVPARGTFVTSRSVRPAREVTNVAVRGTFVASARAADRRSRLVDAPPRIVKRERWPLHDAAPVTGWQPAEHAMIARAMI